MYYLVVIKTLSTGTQERNLTAYDNEDTALRKFHEAFNVIGGGPKRISAILMSDSNETYANGVFAIKNETWTLKEEVSE